MRRVIAVLVFVIGVVGLAPAQWVMAQASGPDGVVANPRHSSDAPGFASAREQPRAFGTAIQATIIHASQWVPYTGTGPVSNLYGYAVPSDTTPYYWVQLNVPVGATVSVIDALVYDNDLGDWEFRLSGYEAARFSSLKHLTLGTAASSGTPGYTNLTIYPGDIVFHTFTDLDGDGTENPVAYVLSLHCNVHSTLEMRFWGAEVFWYRTVSPAPASATFNDVPTGYWAFRFIEALYSSGITAGCGGGNYCPEAPITRAEMAVFLAGALGLHYPE